jgi:hypothetical protein
MFRSSWGVPLRALAFFLLVNTHVGLAEETTEPPDVIILKGCPLGGVLFPHKAHAGNYAGGRCETCHHPSRPEKPSTAPQQACRSCHVTPPPPPMKTGTEAAFHNPSATSGTCIDCHVRLNAAGKKAPTQCMQCHKRENA